MAGYIQWFQPFLSTMIIGNILLIGFPGSLLMAREDKRKTLVTKFNQNQIKSDMCIGSTAFVNPGTYSKIIFRRLFCTRDASLSFP